MELIAAKLNGVRETGLTDASGYPRVAASFGGGGTPQSYMGTFPAFLAAWGPVDMGFGSGQGVKCYHSEHLYGEFWHRAFIVAPDTPLCNYLISCGANVEASGGVAGVWRHAKARVRGMKRVQVEPHLSVTGACSAQWVPIKPKTDAAFLYALIHVHAARAAARQARPAVPRPGTRPRRIWSGPRAPTCAIAPPASRWSGTRRAARPCRTTRRASPKRWKAAGRSTAIEIGADEEVLVDGVVSAETSFGKLLAHMQPYSPEWAAGRLRRQGRRHAQDRAGIFRARLRRPDHRDRRQDHAVPARGGVAGQDRQQRLGRLRMLLGAHAAGLPGRRARGARRNHRHHRAAGAADVGAAAGRQARPRRFHALPAEPDRQGALVAQSQHPQRLPHHGAAGGRRSLEPGPGADPFLLDVPGRHAGRPAARHLARRLVRLPHQSRDLVLGHRGAGREDGEVPLRRGLRLHPRRDQPFRRRAAARSHRPGKPATDPHRRHQVHRAVLGPRGLRLAPAGGGRARRVARLHRDRQRTGAAHRPHGEIHRLDQQGRRRRAAQGRAHRLLARPGAQPQPARKSGTPSARPPAPS